MSCLQHLYIRKMCIRDRDMNDAWAGEGNIFKDAPATKFVGYELDACDATVAAMSGDGLSEGEQGIIALDKTPFYAESGGQVGDHGIISNNGGEFAVEDVKKNEDGVYMHMGRVISGKFAAGDIVKAEIDVIRRNAIRRNHTATHLPVSYTHLDVYKRQTYSILSFVIGARLQS